MKTAVTKIAKVHHRIRALTDDAVAMHPIGNRAGWLARKLEDEGFGEVIYINGNTGLVELAAGDRVISVRTEGPDAGVWFEEEDLAMSETRANSISSALGDDGTIFETQDGRTLANLCEAAGADLSRHGERWRYEFPDGSKISGNASGWDLGEDFWLSD